MRLFATVEQGGGLSQFLNSCVGIFVLFAHANW